MKNRIIPQKDISKNIDEQIAEVSGEFRRGFEFIEKYPHRVTIFGSAQTIQESVHYQVAEGLAYRIAKELKYTIVTGGGPGIMRAANKGARTADAKTIGLGITLPREQHMNEFVTDSVVFQHFFIRKAILAFATKAYVFFPGGFGTFDELFGILTLIQTNKIPRVPVILIGKDFWGPLQNFIHTNMYEEHSTIGKGDMTIYMITDSPDEALDAIKSGPDGGWWKDAD
jgi:uncharacterized protein (TIGR00730 family)